MKGKKRKGASVTEDIGAGYYAEYKSGSDEAVEKLVDLYYDGLTLYISGIVGDLHASEDIAQDVFVRLVTKKPSFNGRSSFKTWLYAIGRNLARDYLRKAKRQGVLPLENGVSSDETEDVEQSYIKNEEYISLYRGLRLLKEEYRQALWLTYFEGMSVKEVARIMNRSESSVTALISRGKFALRKSITDEGGNKQKDERS